MLKKPVPNSSKKDAGEEKITKGNLEDSSLKDKLVLDMESAIETKERKDELKPEEIQEMRERIEKTELDDSLKVKASAHAQSIKNLDEGKKIKKLLELAKTKGVIYAVSVAKKMNDPYVLDMLHDILAKGGYYKKFTK